MGIEELLHGRPRLERACIVLAWVFVVLSLSACCLALWYVAVQIALARPENGGRAHIGLDLAFIVFFAVVGTGFGIIAWLIARSSLREDDEVTSVGFSPDGRSCLSGSEDGKLRLWDVLTGQCVRTF